MKQKYIKVHKSDFIETALKLGFVPHQMMNLDLHIPNTVVIKKTLRANQNLKKLLKDNT
jgi:hypothetical protein